MQNALHALGESALGLLATLAPVAVLVLLATACANANRVRLTALAERLPPLKLLLWAGVATHECGHLLMCLLTFTRIRQVQIKWHSGFVKHDARGPIPSALIAGGPLVSATLLAVVATAWLFGSAFASAAAPFRAPLSSELTVWTQTAAFSLFRELLALSVHRWYVHLPVLLVLAGMLSSASPSPPDLANATSGLAWLTALALTAETCARALAGTSLLAYARPFVGEVTGALGIATFACLLGALLIFPLSLLLTRK